MPLNENPEVYTGCSHADHDGFRMNLQHRREYESHCIHAGLGSIWCFMNGKAVDIPENELQELLRTILTAYIRTTYDDASKY